MGYSLSANWQTDTGMQNCSFVYISNLSSADTTSANVNWYDYHYPNSVNNSANSVYLNNTISFYETVEQVYAHACIAAFTWINEPNGDDDSNSQHRGWRLWVIIVCVVLGACLFLAVYVHQTRLKRSNDSVALLKPRETSIDVTI